MENEFKGITISIGDGFEGMYRQEMGKRGRPPKEGQQVKKVRGKNQTLQLNGSTLKNVLKAMKG